MSSLPNVAIIGATGLLGSVVLGKVLAAGFPVTILTRQGSSSTSKLASHPNQTIKEVDYSSKDSLTAALKGTQVVVSTITTTQTGEQNLLIDSALATGTVKRFIPSEFGSDTYHPKNKGNPLYLGKIATVKYLNDLSAAHPNFTYTSIQNNVFLDWGLQAGFIVDAKKHSATLWDGGDVPFSTTTLATVADTVVAVLKNLDSTANRVIKVHDTVVTQNQLIEIIKKVDGKEWSTETKSVKEKEAETWAEWNKPDKDFSVIFGFLVPALWGEGRDVYASQVDNKELGIEEMSKADLEEAVKRLVKA